VTQPDIAAAAPLNRPQCGQKIISEPTRKRSAASPGRFPPRSMTLQIIAPEGKPTKHPIPGRLMMPQRLLRRERRRGRPDEPPAP
jgi:hypothetical protein